MNETTTKTKRSCPALPKAMSFLVANGIPFTFQKDAQNGRSRLFFLADDDTANEMHELTGRHIYDETDCWGFGHWEAVAKY